MSPQRRRVMLGVAGLATLAATAWVANMDGPAPTPAVPARAAASAARDMRADAPPRKLDLQVLQSRGGGFGESTQDPFAPRTWAPSSATSKSAAPVAPALPYTYFGRMTESGRTVVFLQRGERSYTVRSGDLLDNIYRVDDITPTAVILTYLPLKQRQSLRMGAPTQ